MHFLITISVMNIHLSPEIQASILGVSLSGLSVALGMPFDNIKTRMQVLPGVRYREILTDMCKEGFPEFYRGTTPFLFQRVLKAALRTPVMIGTIKLTESMPESVLTKNFTNASIASFFDTFIVNPTEVIKVKIMTDQRKTPLLKLITFQDLKRGFGWTFLKTHLSWMNFYLMRDLSLYVNQQLTGETRLSPTALLINGILTSGTKIALTTPADVIKTNLQQAQQNQNNLNSRTVIKHILKNHGWKKLFTGMGPRGVHSLMSTIIGNYVLDFYDHSKKRHA